MKYRRVSVFIIISIFLLISAQFASADSGSHTLRENQGLELYDGHSIHISQINIGEGSAWFEVRKDGEQKAVVKLYEQQTHIYRQNDIKIFMQLEEVFQGQVDSLAVIYTMMEEPVWEEAWEVPVEEAPVEEYYEEPVAEEVVYEEPVAEEEYVPVEELPSGTIVVGAILLLFFGTVGIIIKKTNDSSKKRKIPIPSTIVKTTKDKQSNTPIIEKQETKPFNNIEVKSAFSYKGATILYKIKIENPTPEPIGDIKINLYVPDVFLVSESTKSIAMLKPSESKTVTFEIRPTGECGDCEVSGKVVYYDYSTKKTSEIEIPAKNLSIVCPMLHSKEISEEAWRNALSGFARAEESTKEIDMPASTLFDITTDILQDMNLYMLEPKINDSSNLYRAVAKFYGEGVKELKYAAHIEVVGGAKKSKLILKSWAEREDALTGFYHGVLDEIEKRVHVKGYINDNIVQNFHHYGDNIGTQIKDSLVQRSNIGTGDMKKCLNCGRDVDANEKFCLECGTKID